MSEWAPTASTARALAIALLVVGRLAAANAEADEGTSDPGLAARVEPWAEGERLGAAAVELGQRLALAPGVRLGALTLAQTWSDFRAQAIAPGRYELRYLLQPRLKEHVGADAIRDFALLVPAGAERAATPLGTEDWIVASRRVSGTRHPAVMALVPWNETDPPPAGAVEREGRRVAVRDLDGVRIGFVIEGRAPLEEAL